MKTKRILSVVLSLLMTLGCFSPAAFAQVQEAENAGVEAETERADNTEPELTSDAVIFVSDAGDDANSGQSADRAVRTLRRAIELLGDGGGTAVVCGSVEFGEAQDGAYVEPGHTGLVYVSSVYGGVDYRESGAKLAFAANSKTSAFCHYKLGGKTTFENVSFDCPVYIMISALGNFITMGEGISANCDLSIAGLLDCTDEPAAADRFYTQDTHIIIKSGTYSTVAGFSRNAKVASEESDVEFAALGDSYITVDGGTVAFLIGKAVNSVGGKYGNSYIEINGGTFTGSVAGATYNANGGTFGHNYIEINGTPTFSTYFAGVATKPTNGVYSGADITVNGGNFKSAFQGGSYQGTTPYLGDITTKINAGSFTFLNGISMDTTDAACGVMTLEFAGGNVANNFSGGAYRGNIKADIMNVTASGGTINVFCGGSYGTSAVGVSMKVNRMYINLAGTTVKGDAYAAIGYSAPDSCDFGRVYVNVSAGAVNGTDRGLCAARNVPSGKVLNFDLVSYNISGGTINKMYAGAGYGNKANGRTVLVYSGGTITGALSTARMSGYHKYYFMNGKKITDVTFSVGTADWWPNFTTAGSAYRVEFAEDIDRVYLDTATGSWANDGLSADKPLFSLIDAVAALGEDGGEIVITSPYEASGGLEIPETNGKITFTTSDSTTDFAETNGAYFRQAGAIYLGSDTEFTDITFSNTAQRNIYARGHSVTFTESVRTADGSVPMGLFAGNFVSAAAAAEGGLSPRAVSYYDDQTITLLGGEFYTYIGGNARGGNVASVGTHYGDMTLTAGGNVRFVSDIRDDDIACNAFQMIGMNIHKGTLTVNITGGYFDTPMYVLGRMGVYTNNTTHGLFFFEDARVEVDATVNISGGEFAGGIFKSAMNDGDNPNNGTLDINVTGGSFADDFKFIERSFIGGTRITGSVASEGFDIINGKENAAQQPLRVVCIGDSITQGAGTATETVDGYTYGTYNFTYPAYLDAMLGRGGIAGNFGYGGSKAYFACSSNYYGSSSWGLARSFGDADAVVIALGTNDWRHVYDGGVYNEYGENTYKASLGALIEYCHAEFPDAVVYLTTAIARYDHAQAAYAVENIIVPAQREVAAEYSYVKLIDLYELMLPYGEEDMASGEYKYYHTDKLHLQNGGYEKMAELILGGMDYCYYDKTVTEPTCTESGYTSLECIYCGDKRIDSDSYTDPLGHDFSVELGRTEPADGNDGEIRYECSRCGIQTTVIIKADGKDYEKTEIIAPTCTEQGYTRHICSSDGTYYDDTYIPALGHDYAVERVESTCVTEGSITYTCRSCGHSYTETIPTSGHTPTEATCTEPSVCTVCSEKLADPLGHSYEYTVAEPGEHTLGLRTGVCSVCKDTYSEYIDATEGLVVFVDTNAEENGNGSEASPFKTYTAALQYADGSFDRTIVLMSTVAFTGYFTEPAHEGRYTVTSVFDGKDYGGGWSLNSGAHYILSGPLTLDDMTVNVDTTTVIRARFNPITVESGVEMTGNLGTVILVGGDQGASSTMDTSKDTHITLRGGYFSEVIGGGRSGIPKNYTGTVNIYVGEDASVGKLFIGHRSVGAGARIGSAEVVIDGGRIGYFLTGTDTLDGACTGNIKITVTNGFGLSGSFTEDTSTSTKGFSGSAVLSSSSLAALANSGRIELYLYSAYKALDMGLCDEASFSGIYDMRPDIDGDGEINNTDLTLTVRYLAGFDMDIEDDWFDINGDGRMNNRDAITLIQRLAFSTSDIKTQKIDFGQLEVSAGSYAYKNGVLSANNAGTAGAYALTNVTFDGGSYYSLEANITSPYTGTDNTAEAGLAFGYGSGRHFVFALNRQNVNVRIVEDGKTDVTVLKHAPLSSVLTAIKGGASAKLRLDVFPGGECVIYLDTEIVGRVTVEGMDTGRVGFYTNGRTAEFSAISLRSVNTVDFKDAFSIEGAEENTALSGNFSRAYDVALGEDKVYIDLDLPKGCFAYLDGKQLFGSRVEIPVDDNIQKNELKITDLADGDMAVYHLFFYRHATAEQKLTYDADALYYHYAPTYGQIGDPNGLVYNEKTGEYHLYHQHQLYGVRTSSPHWSLATSKDLVNWTEQHVVLAPDEYGYVMSGCGVIDRNNTSGLFDETVAPEERIVALFSYSSVSVGLAYSTDGGMSFTKYGEPVIPTYKYTNQFRDPKVIWFEDETLEGGGEWLMVIAGGKAHMYTSPDLINWTFAGDICGVDGVQIDTECPDLFPLTPESDPDDTKWVFSAGGKYVVIGDLTRGGDGIYSFDPIAKHTLFDGTRGYAAQSYYNTADGRRIIMSWNMEWGASALEGSKVWNAAQCLPMEMKLTLNAGGEYGISVLPVSEIENAIPDEAYVDLSGTELTTAEKVLTTDKEISAAVIDVRADVSSADGFKLKVKSNGTHATYISYSKAAGELTFDLTKSGTTAFSPVVTRALAPDADGVVSLRVYIDRCTVEVFSEDGSIAAAFCANPNPNRNGMSITAVGGTVTLDSLKIYDMVSNRGEDTYRPNYHLTREYGFLADPNGLWYDALTGTYHTYFQSYEQEFRGGSTSPSWGHATSTDLVNWTHHGFALDFGYDESGCAVVDVNNTSGLFDESTPPEQRVVAIYSRGFSGVESQWLAYSTDGGYSFIDGGMVITPEQSAFYGVVAQFRDPKIVWIEDETRPNGGCWLMMIGGGRAQMFASDDLLTWEWQSAVTDTAGNYVVTECPDFFPLELDGNGENEKWILSGGGNWYTVGALAKGADGKYVYTIEQDKREINLTSSFSSVYATQSFYNDPQGRRMSLNWMVDTSSDKLVLRDKEWNGVMSLAYVYRLITDGDVMLLTSLPAEQIYSELCTDADFSYSGSLGSSDADALLSSLDGESYIIRAKIKADGAGVFGFKLRAGDENETIVYYDAAHGIFAVDTTDSGDLASNPTYKYTGGVYSKALALDEDGYVTLDIFVDNCVLEVFANGGRAACSVLVFPDKDDRGLGLFSEGNITVDTLDIFIIE